MSPHVEHACPTLALLLVGCATASAQPPRACPVAPPCAAKATPEPVAAPLPALDVGAMKERDCRKLKMADHTFLKGDLIDAR